jgi:hypothetical protein
MADLTVAEMQEYVRNAWVWLQVRESEPFEGIPQGKWVVRIPLFPLSNVWFDCESEAWQAAYAFTKLQEEQIRLVEEEIATQSEFCRHGDECGLCEVVARTVGRLQAALAELQRGWRMK